jgi:hypothetical protein
MAADGEGLCPMADTDEVGKDPVPANYPVVIKTSGRR